MLLPSRAQVFVVIPAPDHLLGWKRPRPLIAVAYSVGPGPPFGIVGLIFFVSLETEEIQVGPLAEEPQTSRPIGDKKITSSEFVDCHPGLNTKEPLRVS